MDPLEQFEQLMKDIADAIREKMSSKYDFTDMPVFNQVCEDATRLTVNQSVFNAVKSIFERPSFFMLGTNVVDTTSVYLYSFSTTSDGEIIDLSDIVVEQLSDRVRIHNNSNYGLRYGFGYGNGTSITTPSNIGQPSKILTPHSSADLQAQTIRGNIFNDTIGKINAQQFSTLIRNLNV